MRTCFEPVIKVQGIKALSVNFRLQPIVRVFVFLTLVIMENATAKLECCLSREHATNMVRSKGIRSSRFNHESHLFMI